MLYYLAELSQNLNALNVFRYITFRAGGAFFTALVYGFLFGRPLIEMLRVRQGRGQPIRADGPESHLITKAGTPTMGGLLILSAILVSTLLWARWDNGYVWLVHVRHPRLRPHRLRRRLRQGAQADRRRGLRPGPPRRRLPHRARRRRPGRCTCTRPS